MAFSLQLVSSRPEILESALFQEFLRSGVILLRKANALNPHRSRKRTLLGIMKGQSVEEEEAKVGRLISRDCNVIVMCLSHDAFSLHYSLY